MKYIKSFAITLALLGAFAAHTANAGVDVYTLIVDGEDGATAGWAKSFSGDNKGKKSDTNKAAKRSQDSLSGGAYGQPVGVGVENEGGLMQTFAGDDKQLEGVGFYLANLGSDVGFTLTLFEYGPTAPTTPAALAKGKIVFTEKGTLPKRITGTQYYFDLSNGGATNLALPVLQSKNTYGIQLVLSGLSGTAYSSRGTKSDAYKQGISATVKNGAYTLLAVGASAETMRKLNFAIYTAPRSK